MERNVQLENGQQIHVSNWDEGVWFKMSNRYASIHTTMSRHEAEWLITALQIVLGMCPKCGSEEWAAVAWSGRQGVTPYKEYAECSCGHTWGLED